MLCALTLSGTGVIPLDTPVYDAVWRYLMPLAAALFLLECDVLDVWRNGGQLLTAFLIGAAGMMAGAIVGWALLKGALGPQAGCIAASLCSSYIGGSINFVAVSSTVGLDAALVPAAIAADNVAMVGYLAVLMALPVGGRVAAAAAGGAGAASESEAAAPATTGAAGVGAGTGPAAAATAGGEGAAGAARHEPAPAAPGQQHPNQPRVEQQQQQQQQQQHQNQNQHADSGSSSSNNSNKRNNSDSNSSSGGGSSNAGAGAGLTTTGIALSLATGGAACALSEGAARALSATPLKLMFMSVIAVALASLLRVLLAERPLAEGAPAAVRGGHSGGGGAAAGQSPFAGASQIGSALMLVFFAVVGANAGGLSQLSACWPMVAFMTVMVCVHWAVLAAAGAALRLPRAALVLASNSCIGGPATAASMAVSRGWTGMAHMAMLIGSLGYAIGTVAGLVVAKVSGAMV
ncbi:hypothetical protein FOA52_000115 [Chlamydomonas sp. UWO 241]|nr:hypothetical protein FOA52_000115 [Chlamydomonas sp. UWO 241]